MEAEQLLSDYNYYRAFTNNVIQKRNSGKFMTDLKPKPDRLQALQDMAAFCSEHDADPRLWLYMLFQSRRWLFAPRFNQLVPKSKKIIEKNLNRYSNLSDVPLFQKRIGQQIHQQAIQNGQVFDRNRDIDWTIEGLKRRYLNEGDSARCIDEMEDRTLGFHPLSLVCARCPVCTQCEQILRSKVAFDIVALRRGTITAQQAQQLANRYGS